MKSRDRQLNLSLDLSYSPKLSLREGLNNNLSRLPMQRRGSLRRCQALLKPQSTRDLQFPTVRKSRSIKLTEPFLAQLK